MATITLPVARSTWLESDTRDFEIDSLSFTRSIVRQGRGARAAWRQQFATLDEIPQSHEVIEWDERRKGFWADVPLHGIRTGYRRWLPFEERYSDDKPLPDLPHGDAGTPSDDTPAPGADDI